MLVTTYRSQKQLEKANIRKSNQSLMESKDLMPHWSERCTSRGTDWYQLALLSAHSIDCI
jgi:hypothetical protein